MKYQIALHPVSSVEPYPNAPTEISYPEGQPTLASILKWNERYFVFFLFKDGVSHFVEADVSVVIR